MVPEIIELQGRMVLQALPARKRWSAVISDQSGLTDEKEAHLQLDPVKTANSPHGVDSPYVFWPFTFQYQLQVRRICVYLISSLLFGGFLVGWPRSGHRIWIVGWFGRPCARVFDKKELLEINSA